MTRDRLTRTALAAAAIVPVVGIAALVHAADAPPSLAVPAFSADEYAARVRYLASNRLGGREPGSEGIAQAEHYIIEQFKAAGLKPAGEEGGWTQMFTVPRGRAIDAESARLEIDGLGRACELGKDWTPYSFSATEGVAGQLAFAGYGISAKDFDYDDFAEFDAQDKILLVLRYEPQSKDRKAEFGGDLPSRHALFRRKAENAAKHGARGVLIVTPPSRALSGPELAEFEPRDRQRYELPMANITRALADELLGKAGLPNLATLEQRLTDERKPLSADTKLTVRLDPGVKTNRIETHNVLGVLPGDGSSDEYLVIGAHYDHLGIRPASFQAADRTPRIHNGADDNASGTAGLIELAGAFGAGPRPHRNMLFIAFSAEEMGLLGSEHFVKQPTIDLDKVRAMYNLDMIGRLSQGRLTIYGSQTAKEFKDIAERAGAAAGLTFRLARGVPRNSDHAPFHKRGIPVIFPFTGLHKQYHKPEDDWELIDAEGATRVLSFSYRVLAEIGGLPAGPTAVAYNEPAGMEDRVMRPAAEEDTSAAAPNGKSPAEAAGAKDGSPRRESDRGGPAAMPRVRLGIAPDYDDDEKPGLLIDSVSEGGVAQAAGIRDGDRIVKIGDSTITNIEGYMTALASYQPGDSVEIVVERKDERLTFKVTFRAAPAPRERN